MNQLSRNRYPMVAAVIPFMAGIVLFDAVMLPMWALWGGFLLSLMLAVFGLRSRVANIYIIAALVLFGGVVVSLRAFQPQVPMDKKLYIALEVEDNPIIRKAFSVMTARIVEYEDNGEIYEVDERVNLYVDTLVHVSLGDHIEALGRVVPFPEEFGSYGELMLRRGVGGTLFLRADDVMSIERNKGRNLHVWAVERLARLGLAGDEAAIVGAMSAGERRGVTPQLRQAYSRSGASHILAVSGLHVGIVFMLINLLLAWLPLVRHGQILRAIAAVGPIWVYAAMCGFSPSVVRAAVMFTALQTAVATSSLYVSFNVLATTAFALLIYRPDQLFDISFQLSFIAVAAILLWAIPLMRVVRTGRVWVDALSATVVVGVVSSIATMPLVAHTFGIVSLVGVLLNPLVILCAYVIIFVAVLWIVLPITLLAGVVGWVLATIAGVQNYVVERVSAWRWSAVEITLPEWGVWVIYGVAVAITLLLRYLETKKSVHLSL